MKSQKSAEAEVRSWGFSHVFTWTDSPNSRTLTMGCGQEQDRDIKRSGHINNTTAITDYPPHSHPGLTTHLILKGELTITYPNETTPEKETHGVGARIDVDAGKLHEVWVGKEGCTYVIGE